MKQTINVFLITVAMSIFLLSGCSKGFLDKKPNDAVAISDATSTESGLQDLVTGIYAKMRSSSLFGEDLPITGDVMADNAFIEIKNSGRYLPQYNYSITVADGVASDVWTAAYNAILEANLVINATTTGSNVASLKAQAYGLRALLYFKLVNVYARPYTDNPDGLGVPLILTYNPGLLPKRNTVKEVYNQIISDYKAGFAKAPDYTSSVILSKYAIEALMAKAYLYMGDNVDAKAAAVDVINNSGFTLVTPANYTAYWNFSGRRTDKVETLFEIDEDAINNNGFDDVAGLYNNGYQDLYCSVQLYNLYSPTDVRTSVLIPSTTKSGSPAIIVNKFPNAQNSDRDNLKVIRLAEVYLIAAEASLPGNEADARKYLNLLMQQRDPSFAGYTSTGANLLNDIVQERRKELAFEGDRLWDLNRLKRDIVRSQNAGAIPAGQNNSMLTIPYSDYRRILPIPQSETQVNPNLAAQQNPGYK